MEAHVVPFVITQGRPAKALGGKAIAGPPSSMTSHRPPRSPISDKLLGFPFPRQSLKACMLKFLVLLVLFVSCGIAGYWYGYRMGHEDAVASNQSRSLESKTEAYVRTIRSLDIQYTDKDGNIVIPKVQWDEMKKREANPPAAEVVKP